MSKSMSKTQRFAQGGKALAAVEGLVKGRNQLAPGTTMVPLDEIDPDLTNSRPILRLFDWNNPRNLDSEHPRYAAMKEELARIEDLAQNIKKQGQLQPVTLRHKGERHELIIGHRRFLAMKLLGQPSVWAALPRSISAAHAQFAENYHRADVDLQGRIEAIEKVLAEEGLFPLDTSSYQAGVEGRQKAVQTLVAAGAMGERAAYQYVRIVNASSDVRQAIADGRISSLQQASELAELEGEALEHALSGETADDHEGGHKQQEPEKSPAEAPPKRRGRKPTAVSVRVKNTHVVRQLVHHVMGADAFPHIDWNDYSSAQQALQEMLEHLEQRLNDEAP